MHYNSGRFALDRAKPFLNPSYVAIPNELWVVFM